MNATNSNVLLMLAALLLLIACGDQDDGPVPASDFAYGFANNGTDESQLPDDFPHELIPTHYDQMNYVDMSHIGGIAGASFESTAPVQRAIDHYIGILGEPKISVGSADEERMLQWHTTPHPPWIVGVMGTDSETIVAISKAPEQ